MFKRFTFFFFSLIYLGTLPAQAEIDISQIENIRQQLTSLNKEGSDEAVKLAQNLEGTLQFLEKANRQQEELKGLEEKIKSAPEILAQHKENIIKLQQEVNDNIDDFSALSLEEIEVLQTDISNQLQSLQTNFSELNSSLSSYRVALEQTRRQISENNLQADKLTRWKYNAQASRSLIEKYDAELKFLEGNTKYNQLLGQNIDLLISIDEAKKSETQLKQQRLQQQLTSLQDIVNEQRIKEYEEQARLAEEAGSANPIVQRELSINTYISQDLVLQTQKVNQLTQDNLRIKENLESLAQTQRNIEEQISALQGTLVLSKIINQQKQNLPSKNIIQNLAKDIANIRVKIFELSQQRDELYNISSEVGKLEFENKVPFSDEDKKSLEKILQEREKLLVDLIKIFNSELNISNEIESTQKQIIAISDSLQSKLQQQSFWVQSNNPIDLSWAEEFPNAAIMEITVLTRYLGFDNLGKNLLPTLAFIGFLLSIYGVILWKKSAIKARLATLASQVNTLKNDSHWHSPEAMFWTIVLALPSALMYLAIASLVLYIFFPDPITAWEWTSKTFGYWLFFATILSLLRPNGMAFRHFGLPQASNHTFQTIIRESVWIVVLLLVSSIFSQVEMIGFTNDVIGQVMMIIALGLCTFWVRPQLARGIQEYENARTEDGKKRNVSLFKLVRLALFVIPVGLIVLIVLGYYYTAVYLIDHIIKSYMVALIWVFGRYFAYRSLTISSRRMAYRRLQEKREKLREQMLEQGETKEKPEEVIKISTVNEQIFRMADLVGWVILFALFYRIWSDLISIANYLNTIILWESVENTSKGRVIESVTLLNILRSLLYATITYVLVKNIKGIMEVTVFSRIRFSKGTPHTITAVLTYVIVTIGSIAAFTALGISWNKLQWVFTALSVGLGFGVREIFGSFVSGTILLFERPIRVGDKVTVGAFTGVITRIRLRSTTLIDDDNKEVVLPNQAFVTDRFINWTLNNTITRLQIGFKISSGADLDLVRTLLLQAAEDAPKAITDPAPKVNLLHFGEGWIEHELTVHVQDVDDRAETRNFLYQRIDQLFNQHGIKIAFNHLDVHLHNPQQENQYQPILTQQ